MSEYSLLTNGRFNQDLDGWTLDGAVYQAGDSDDHYGVAELETGGDNILQTFSVSHLRRYQIHLDVKAVGGALETTDAQVVITDGDGNTVKTSNLTGVQDTWTENIITLGLGPGTTYTIKIINNTHADGVLRVDDVWLYGTIILRSEIATLLVDKLGQIATEKSLSAVADGVKTEGDYTYAIDAGLRSLGLINPETGLPDIRYLVDPGQISQVVEGAMSDMLEGLILDYVVEPDIQVGPRRESRSQISKGLREISGGGGSSGGGKSRVISRKMKHD